jgi:hypothetical protein
MARDAVLNKKGADPILEKLGLGLSCIDARQQCLT